MLQFFKSTKEQDVWSESYYEFKRLKWPKRYDFHAAWLVYCAIRSKYYYYKFPKMSEIAAWPHKLPCGSPIIQIDISDWPKHLEVNMERLVRILKILQEAKPFGNEFVDRSLTVTVNDVDMLLTAGIANSLKSLNYDQRRSGGTHGGRSGVLDTKIGNKSGFLCGAPHSKEGSGSLGAAGFAAAGAADAASAAPNVQGELFPLELFSCKNPVLLQGPEPRDGSGLSKPLIVSPSSPSGYGAGSGLTISPPHQGSTVEEKARACEVLDPLSGDSSLTHLDLVSVDSSLDHRFGKNTKKRKGKKVTIEEGNQAEGDPNGASLQLGATAKPKRKRPSTATKTPTGEPVDILGVWAAYKEAFQTKWNIQEDIGLPVGEEWRACRDIAQRLGNEEAKEFMRFYLTCTHYQFVRYKHRLRDVWPNWRNLHADFLRGREVTDYERKRFAKQIEEPQKRREGLRILNELLDGPKNSG